MAEYSPMMQHYLATKEEYKDCILFYRLGDFYEMFFDDAITTSRELELTLTGKDCGQEERAPMCGIPFHAAEVYISRLIGKGYKVAICEQVEDPKQAKGIVKREVIRVVTPGTVIESNMLDEKKNNYIMSIYKNGLYFGMAVCDISTGDFFATQIKETNNFAVLLDEISRYTPAEIVVNDMLFNTTEEVNKIKERFECYLSKLEDNIFETDYYKAFENFSIYSDGKIIDDIEEKKLALISSNGLINYLNDTQKIKLEHINRINIYNTTKYMALDINTRRNLELTEKMRDKSKKGTLLWVLDKTSTSMGGRQLRRWINDPLIDVTEINNRLDSVKELKDNMILKGDLIDALKRVYDIERLIGKISYGNANARDMVSLKNSVGKLPEIKELLAESDSKMLKNLYEELDELEDIYELINSSIVEEPPITIKEGGIIKLGYNQEIDEYKEATINGKKWIVELEASEKEKTGIKNLKVGYNKVFGYFLEVTKSYLSQVPDYYIRKQTLANAERYITEDLKNLEEKTLGAQDKLIDLEYKVFQEIRAQIASKIQRIQKAASIVSTIDVLCSFATVALDLNYCMPIVDNSGEVNIKDGRHPVIEKMLPSGEFIENDTYLIGSFVPASYAKIGVVDKIFTRVGASDDLSMGQSTFMVEMMEVANILKEATNNSLVILDEIGRGTSTYDGLSIAWAVAEYIANKEKCGAKTLFATHYHELTELENRLEGVKNYSIAVKEKGEDVIFLRKIVKGGTDESYGIHVAKLAGVPKDVLKRANEILKGLERKSILINKAKEKEDKKQVAGQLDMYNYKLADIAHELDKININELTPIDALNILVKLKESAS